MKNLIAENINTIEVSNSTGADEFNQQEASGNLTEIIIPDSKKISISKHKKTNKKSGGYTDGL